MAYGIPTTYDGVNYRSRLEARRAAFFRQIGWRFTYEPFDTDGYIPDFLIHGDSPLLVEVKPAVTAQDYRDVVPKLEAALEGCWDHDVLIVGVTPIPDISFDDVSPYGGAWPQYASAGLLGERYDHREQEEEEWFQANGLSMNGWSWSAGKWYGCGTEISVFHEYQSYHGRPNCCGHGGHPNGLPPSWCRYVWKSAGNAVQWKAHKTGSAS